MTVRESLANRKTVLAQPNTVEFQPILILEIELSQPLPGLPVFQAQTGRSYRLAHIVVRLHSAPLGIVDIEIPKSGLEAAELADTIWLSLASEIQDHLSMDGLTQTHPLDQHGLASLSTPTCWQGQHDLLASPPFVSIVIATRDRVASLQECIQSILALDYPHYEVVIVDNAPTSSETEDFVRTQFGHSDTVRYLREDIPGLAIAHNRALTTVKAPIVAFTDDDVVVDSKWLKSIVMNFQQDPEIGCVTGMILPFELETPSQVWIEQFGGFGKGYQRIMFDLEGDHSQDLLFPYSAGRFGSGANMAFRTSMLKALGGFDPAMGAGTPAMGGDDLAVFFDVITNDHRLVYEPRAILYHKHHRDYRRLARQAYGYGVGLSAFLTKTILDKPARLAEMFNKMPAGLKHFLDPHSPKNQKKQADYPRELTQLELKGFLIGPLKYLQSRWRVRTLREQLPNISEISTLGSVVSAHDV